MTTLYKIGDLSQKLKITTRTLRYYEEIGLIESTKTTDSNYRHYCEDSLSRIKQILVLRRLSFSIKEIQEIFSLEDSNSIMPIFIDKLRILKSESIEQESLINAVEKLIDTLDSNRSNRDIDLDTLENIYQHDEEITLIEHSNPNGIKGIANSRILGDTRILRIRPIRVAFYRTISDQPEKDAWSVMNSWIKKNRLDELSTTRYMGFNNPNPSEDRDVYGYEVWVTVNDHVIGDDIIGIKVFEGGLYAVASTNMYDIVQSWQLLYNRIDNNSNYEIGEHRWIEEHLIIDESSWGSNMQVDLYCPLKPIIS